SAFARSRERRWNFSAHASRERGIDAAARRARRLFACQRSTREGRNRPRHSALLQRRARQAAAGDSLRDGGVTPIARKEKSPIELPPPPPVEEVSIAPGPGGRIARELFALAMLAFAAFGAVSLVSVDIGRSPNLGGPVGAAIAATLGGLIGYQSYTTMILVAWLAQRVWTGAGIVTIAREIGGGVILILALAAAGALWNLHDPKMGGEIGADIATRLSDSLNLAGGLIAVALGLICGLALMLKRAPTELLAGLANKIRRRHDEFELAGGDSRVPFSLGAGDEVDPDGGPAPLKVRLLEIREATAREKRDRAAASK